MKITNRTGLPEAIVEAVRNDGYSRGQSDISVTTLVGPVQIRKLRELHEDKVTEDASDRIWALLGQAVHTILERAAPSEIAEKRLFAEVNGHTISGQLDNLDFRSHRLADFKVTSAWTHVHGLKPEWIAQLNCYAFLCRANGLQVDALEIVAIYRDWGRAQSLRSQDYPQAQVGCLPVPLWPQEFIEQYITERLDRHFGTDYVPCSDQERWAKAEKWAIMKKGRKSAVRVLSSKSNAEDWAMEKGHVDKVAGTLLPGEITEVVLAPGYSLVERPREYVRCERYCPVAEFCGQWIDSQVSTKEECNPDA